MDYKQLYIHKLSDSRLNTSYPLSPTDWAPFKSNKSLDFSDEQDLSFYIHIPFCKQLCTFCEYTRMICPDENIQSAYLTTLRNDIYSFLQKYDFVLRGFDIGGGTPTALSEASFSSLLDIYDYATSKSKQSDDFEPSIEATFESCTQSKIERIAQSKIHRLSLGLQSTDHDVIGPCHRSMSNVEKMKDVCSMAKESGIEIINLDLMYGLPGQGLHSSALDVQDIYVLQPEQVTVYELRTNQLNSITAASKENLYQSYCFLYDNLTAMGYKAIFGQNTFSKDDFDLGVSSYLRSRMLEAVAYKGFGISAQSMCSRGIAYNTGKNAKELHNYLLKPSFEEGDTYILPKTELANKYIAIAGYCNRFAKRVLHRLLSEKEYALYLERVAFLLEEGLLIETEDYYSISRKGFQHYGAIISMMQG